MVPFGTHDFSFVPCGGSSWLPGEVRGFYVDVRITQTLAALLVHSSWPLESASQAMPSVYPAFSGHSHAGTHAGISIPQPGLFLTWQTAKRASQTNHGTSQPGNGACPGSNSRARSVAGALVVRSFAAIRTGLPDGRTVASPGDGRGYSSPDSRRSVREVGKLVSTLEAPSYGAPTPRYQLCAGSFERILS